MAEGLAAGTPTPSNVDLERWRDVVQDAFPDSLPSLDEREDVDDALFDVYGFWEGYYNFRQTLVLPGRILSTNANDTTGSTLTWEFSEEMLFFHRYTLEARSRIVYPGRIVAAVVVAALGFFAGARSGRRRSASLKGDAERTPEGEGEHDR